MLNALKLLPLAAIGALVAGSGLAGAQTPIDVQGTVGVSSRQLFVEDLVGNDLTSIDFGTGGAIPFQVRVEDEDFDNTGFTVDATMTNLYVDSGAALDFTKVIPSANVSVSTLATPVSVLDDLIDVEATIEPVFNLTVELNDAVLCPLLTLGAAPCDLVVNAVQGIGQTVTYAVGDLGDLTLLPIVPQEPETGVFTDPDFEGDENDPEDTAADPAADGADPPTALQLLGGTVIDGADLALLGTLLDDALPDLVDMTEAERDALIPNADFQVAVLDAVDGLVGLGTLTAGQISAILTAAVDATSSATRDALGVSQIASQTAAYRSFPVLELDIPASSEAGSYRGTLVVTNIQP